MEAQDRISTRRMKVLEDNIYTRVKSDGSLSYNVRIRDALEPTGLWYNQTFSSLQFAREVRDEKLAEKFREDMGIKDSPPSNT